MTAGLPTSSHRKIAASIAVRGRSLRFTRAPIHGRRGTQTSCGRLDLKCALEQSTRCFSLAFVLTRAIHNPLEMTSA